MTEGTALVEIGIPLSIGGQHIAQAKLSMGNQGGGGKTERFLMLMNFGSQWS